MYIIQKYTFLIQSMLLTHILFFAYVNLFTLVLNLLLTNIFLSVKEDISYKHLYNLLFSVNFMFNLPANGGLFYAYISISCTQSMNLSDCLCLHFQFANFKNVNAFLVQSCTPLTSA